MQKISPSPANEFLLHTVGAIGKKKENKVIWKKCTSPVNEFSLYNCRNNRKIKYVILFFQI